MHAQNRHILGNRYQLNKMLNQGQMGRIYEADDLFMKQKVAIKVINISEDDLASVSSSTYADMTLSLINEFQILSRLRHPNIVSVYDYGLFEDQPYIVMELLNSTHTIDKIIKKLSHDEKIRLIMQILEGLIYLHRNDIIHRDLKPSNLLVMDGQVKILDFGLSAVSEIVHGRAGTLDYMSPETVARSITIPQSDLYAVGLIAYESLTGRLPFAAGDITSILSAPVNMSQLEHYPVSAIIERLVQKKPQDRFETAYQALQAFSDVTGIPITNRINVFNESLISLTMFQLFQPNLAHEPDIAQHCLHMSNAQRLQ